MANVNRPWGARPVAYVGGAKWNGELTLYAFSASNSTGDAFVGDLVEFDSTNRTLALTDVYAPGCPLVKPVVAALTTTAFRGVIAGFVPEPEYNHSATASLGLMYRQDDTKRYVFVIDNPLVLFDVQEDGNDYVSASDNPINKLSDIAYTAGNTTTGISGVQLDSSGITTGGVLPFRVLGFNRRPDNFDFTASDTNSYAHYMVMIANSDLANANTGA
jgi:hypothetical protein